MKKILARKLSILKSQFVEQFAARFMWLYHQTVTVAQFVFICSKFVNDSWQNGFLYFWTGCCWRWWVCRCVDFQAKLTTYLILHCSLNVNARPVVTFSICQLVNFLKYLHFFINATPTHTKESPTQEHDCKKLTRWRFDMRDLVCAKFLTSYDFIFQGLYKMLTRAANYVRLSINSCKNSVAKLLNNTQGTERPLSSENRTYGTEVMISIISVK